MKSNNEAFLWKKKKSPVPRGIGNFFMVGEERLELSYPCGCYHLKVVRLPISPLARVVLNCGRILTDAPKMVNEDLLLKSDTPAPNRSPERGERIGTGREAPEMTRRTGRGRATPRAEHGAGTREPSGGDLTARSRPDSRTHRRDCASRGLRIV